MSSETGELLVAEGFDGAIVGVTHGPDGGRVVYNAEACVAIVMERDGMSWEEAQEFLEHNTFCAYVGPQSPLYIYPAKADDLEALSEH